MAMLKDAVGKAMQNTVHDDPGDGGRHEGKGGRCKVDAVEVQMGKKSIAIWWLVISGGWISEGGGAGAGASAKSGGCIGLEERDWAILSKETGAGCGIPRWGFVVLLLGGT